MDRNTKILLAVGFGGLAVWWFWQSSAQASLAAHAPTVPVPTPAGPSPSVSDAVTTPAPTTSGGTVAMSASQSAVVSQAAMTTALLNWTQQTKNPTLYAAWINQLSPSDIASMYNILTTYWAGTAPATSAQLTYWNSLVAQYPFLRSQGQGCTNFACN